MIGSVFSAVSVLAVFDGVDVERVGVVFSEADTVIADTQAELGRVAALEFLHIARCRVRPGGEWPSGYSWRCAAGWRGCRL